MKNLKYEEITVENVENLIKTGYITEIICDGDKKTVYINNEEFKKIEKAINQIIESLKPVIETMCEAFKNMCKSLNNVLNDYNKILNKKISKKKFKKLLQSQGIQRNDINKIIKNNREKYTYLRYYKIINQLSKDERK